LQGKLEDYENQLLELTQLGEKMTREYNEKVGDRVSLVTQGWDSAACPKPIEREGVLRTP
jgi:hypothetical protein